MTILPCPTTPTPSPGLLLGQHQFSPCLGQKCHPYAMGTRKMPFCFPVRGSGCVSVGVLALPRRTLRGELPQGWRLHNFLAVAVTSFDPQPHEAQERVLFCMRSPTPSSWNCRRTKTPPPPPCAGSASAVGAVHLQMTVPPHSGREPLPPGTTSLSVQHHVVKRCRGSAEEKQIAASSSVPTLQCWLGNALMGPVLQPVWPPPRDGLQQPEPAPGPVRVCYMAWGWQCVQVVAPQPRQLAPEFG